MGQNNEYDVLEEHLRQLSERDAPRAQQAFTLLLSNFVAGDGFDVDFGEYDSSACLEIRGEDGRRVVIAPLFKWAEGDTEEDLYEWAVRNVGGELVTAPPELQDFADSEIWGSDEFGLDVPRAITFYRRAVDEASRLTGFKPSPKCDA